MAEVADGSRAMTIPDPIAAPSTSRSRRRASEVSISMRISAQALSLIDDAASLSGKSRTEFVLESARRQALDVLLDRRLFTLDDEQHDAFMRALDEPPAPNERLKRLMANPAPWET